MKPLLQILEAAGLLSRRRRGREHRCRLEARRLQAAERWLERRRRFWNERLDALGRYVEEDR